MQGRFIEVWQHTWDEIWEELSAQEDSSSDIFCELYRSMTNALKDPPQIELLADIIDNPAQARNAFRAINKKEISNERNLIIFLESVHEILQDLERDSLTDSYIVSLGHFIKRYNLHYALTAPCILIPTIPGLFSNLFNELTHLTNKNSHLESMMNSFELALKDLKKEPSEERIKTCIQKQINLLEAIGKTFPGVTANQLGDIATQVKSWPHPAMRAGLGNLYGFASDYPGIRHAGNPGSASREIEIKDMVAMAILLIGYSPYLTNDLNFEKIYHGE